MSWTCGNGVHTAAVAVGSSHRYDDSQNFVSQHLVTHEIHMEALRWNVRVSLQTLYDTRNGSFGSGSFNNSGLSTTSYTYADGISGNNMGSSDVLVYQFQTDGWLSTRPVNVCS